MGRATTVRQWTRVVAALAAGAVALTMMTACAPEPVTVPSPTPTGFASEQEAFAAAETTYRAYIDAVNAKRQDANARDPDDFLTGSALEASLEGRRKLDDADMHISGPAQIKSLALLEATTSSAVLSACVDSSETRVLDESGSDVTPSDRADTLSLEVEVVFAVPQPLILRSQASSFEPC